MTAEHVFENQLINLLRNKGIFAHHFDANGVDGWPDILCLHRNTSMLIEVKYRTIKLRTDQTAFRIYMRSLFGYINIFTVAKMDAEFLFIDSTTKPPITTRHKSLINLVDHIAIYFKE